MYEEQFSKRLAELRTKKGVSARDMSLSIGQNPGYIRAIECGTTFPTMSNFFYICSIDLVFKGEGAECWCNGCVIADHSEHVDNNTLIDHQVGHCDSHELYKYVLDGKAVGAFAGKVLVRHGSQKTTSQETNQNLVMTKTARMYTQPMLEIYADDVKCAHGSTVGQLNDAALFYMQQRGIDEHEAKRRSQTIAGNTDKRRV